MINMERLESEPIKRKNKEILLYYCDIKAASPLILT